MATRSLVGLWLVASLALASACGSTTNANTGTGGATQASGTGGTPGLAGASAAGMGAGGAPATGGTTAAGTGGSASAGKGGAGGAGVAGASGASAGHGGASGTSAAGAGGGAGASGAGAGGPFAVHSTAFKDGTTIDAKYRCMAPSPDLAWSGAPAGTMSYAAILQDITPGFSQNFFHWVIYDIPSSVMALPENIMIGYAPSAPAGAHQAAAYNGTVGFNGPCGISGTNTYELTVYALDAATLPGLSMSSAGADVETAITAHKLASAKLTIMSMP